MNPENVSTWSFATTADRPDLATAAKMTQDDLKGYAFAKVFPLLRTTEKSLSLSVCGANLSNAQGVAGRANGDALAATVLTTKDVVVTPARVEGRNIIYWNVMHTYGTFQAACENGAIGAGRLALNTIEKNAADVVFTTARKTAATALANHHVIENLQVLAKSVRAYGKPRLYMSDTAFLAFCQIPEIRARLYAFSKVQGDIGFMALQDEKVMQAISNLLMFDGIAVFDSDIVGAANDTFVGIVAVRDAAFVDSASAMLEAKIHALTGVLGCWLPFSAAPDNPFTMTVSPDSTKKGNLFDAEGYISPTIFNEDGLVVAKFDAAYTEFSA